MRVGRVVGRAVKDSVGVQLGKSGGRQQPGSGGIRGHRLAMVRAVEFRADALLPAMANSGSKVATNPPPTFCASWALPPSALEREVVALHQLSNRPAGQPAAVSKIGPRPASPHEVG